MRDAVVPQPVGGAQRDQRGWGEPDGSSSWRSVWDGARLPWFCRAAGCTLGTVVVCCRWRGLAGRGVGVVRVDPEVAALAAAGTKVVALLATDAWEATKAAVGSVWRRVYPERTEVVEAELVEARGELMAARATGDGQSEQMLTGEWQARLRRLFAVDPEAANELRRVLDELVAQLPEAEQVRVGTMEMTATASGHGRIYQVGQGSQHITER